MRTFDVPMPSNGRFGTPAVIPIREMNLKEKKILYNKPRFEQIVKMVGDCIEDKSVNVNDIYLNDYMSLFVNLRRVTMGDDYSFPVQCRQCGFTQDIAVNLGDLEILEAGPEAESVFSVEILDDDGTVIRVYKCKHLTVRDQLALNRRLLKKKSSKTVFTEGDEWIFGLASRIAEIDGTPVRDPEQIISDLESLASSESDALEDGIAEQDFGIRFSVAHECHNCGYSATYPINITSEFFFRRRNFGAAHKLNS